MNSHAAYRGGHGRRQAGFYLAEVMLTVLVLSIGLLGLGALRVHTKQTNLVAVQRSVASQLAHDLLERMRSNDSALGYYVPTDTVLTLDGAALSQPTPLCTELAHCDPVQLAAFDLWEWEQKLSGAMSRAGDDNVGVLLAPTACISRPTGGGSGEYTIAIAWRSTKAIDNPLVADNDTANDCGTGSAKYDLTSAGDNRMRHLFWIAGYLTTG